jgi:hypothetical protein
MNPTHKHFFWGPRSGTPSRKRAGWRPNLLRSAVRYIEELAQGLMAQPSGAEENTIVSYAWIWGAP